MHFITHTYRDVSNLCHVKRQQMPNREAGRRSPLELKTQRLPSSVARGRFQRACALLASIPVSVWT